MAMSPLPLLDLPATNRPEPSAGTERSRSSAGTRSNDSPAFASLLSREMNPPGRSAQKEAAKSVKDTRPEPRDNHRAERREASRRREETNASSHPRDRAPVERGKAADTARRTDPGDKSETVDQEQQSENQPTYLPYGPALPWTLAASGEGLDESDMTSAGQSGLLGLALGEGMEEGLGLDDLGLSLEPGKTASLEFKTLLAASAGTALGSQSLEALTATSHGPTALMPLNGVMREAAAVPGVYTTSVPVPFQDPSWGEQMINKVLWLTSQNLKSAEIHLNPADLGPVEVRIQVQQDQTSIQIQAHNPSVREALEANVHRLREALAGNGLDLAQFDVSTQSGQGQAEQGERARTRGELGGLEAETDEPQPEAVTTALPGLVDTYV